MKSAEEASLNARLTLANLQISGGSKYDKTSATHDSGISPRLSFDRSEVCCVRNDDELAPMVEIDQRMEWRWLSWFIWLYWNDDVEILLVYTFFFLYTSSVYYTRFEIREERFELHEPIGTSLFDLFNFLYF